MDALGGVLPGWMLVLALGSALATLATGLVGDRWIDERPMARCVALLVWVHAVAIFLLIAFFLGGSPAVETQVRLEVLAHPFIFSLRYDDLSAIVTGLSALCGLVVAKFSRVYLHREEGFGRFFGMIGGLVLGFDLLGVANDLATFFIGWEIIGLASFFLIGFYWRRSESVRNALKVFAVYRVGDLGLFFGLSALQLFPGTHDDPRFSMLASHLSGSDLGHPLFSLACVGIVVAAMAKSAQVPFSFWVPRAMEGPTPSSAIFYGALAVHSGIVLLLRLGPLWGQGPYLSEIVILVGCATAVLAWNSSRLYPSIKGRLAMASVSQVGLIFVEVGLGWHRLALLHMVSHALLRLVQILVSPSILTRRLALDGGVRGVRHVLDSLPRGSLGRGWRLLCLYDSGLEWFVQIFCEHCRMSLRRSRVMQVAWSLVPLGIGGGAAWAWGANEGLALGCGSAAWLLATAGVLARRTHAWTWAILAGSMSLMLAAVSVAGMEGVTWGNYGGLGLVAVAGCLGLGALGLPMMGGQAFQGWMEVRPNRSRWLFLFALILVGVPPSPLFLWEDIVFGGLLGRDPLVGLCCSIAYTTFGIAVIKWVAQITLGEHQPWQIIRS